MTTQQIYEKFQTPVNLQEHMLRVAALTFVILDNWIGNPLPAKSIITACLFHDIAKPMTFDLAKQAQFGMSPEDIQKLEKLQNKLKLNYGANEHQATVAICKEIGCDPQAVYCVDNLEWSYLPRLLDSNDIAALIPIYGDMRIGPKGILSMDQRLKDLQSRTQQSNDEQLTISGKQLEQLIQKNTSIDLNVISDTEINNYFDSLRHRPI